MNSASAPNDPLYHNECQFGGQSLTLSGRVVHWPSQNALILANLLTAPQLPTTLLTQANSPLEQRRYDGHWAVTLELLQDRLLRFAPRTVYCLEDGGDDSALAQRLQRVQPMLRRLVDQHHWLWLSPAGGKDGGKDGIGQIQQLLGGQQATEACVAGVTLRPRAEAGETKPEISGHYQPTAWMGAGHLRLRHRCYVETDNRLILPAFAANSRGADVFGQGLAPLIGDRFVAHLLAEPDIYSAPSHMLLLPQNLTDDNPSAPGSFGRLAPTSVMVHSPSVGLA
ncbi:MAG: hypothetical protein FJX22_04865 [Alphaproteobacteria bacterium]|nr:hypothetical protein [Alphaproteobacteria bacterium]